MWLSVRKYYERLRKLCAVLNETPGKVIFLVLTIITMLLKGINDF